jgi:hypothetical protein
MELIEHELHLDPKAKPIKQRLHCFTHTTRNPFIYDILVMTSPFFVMEQGSLMMKLYISSWMIGLAVNPLVHL